MTHSGEHKNTRISSVIAQVQSTEGLQQLVSEVDMLVLRDCKLSVQDWKDPTHITRPQ